jgi:hypothetical protein
MLPATAAQAGWCKASPAWRPVLLHRYAVPVARPCPVEFVPHRRRVHHHYPYVCLSCGWHAGRAVINTARVGRAPPVTVETDDDSLMSAGRDGASQKTRVIHADAEVTISGPDRMTIRLLRKPRAK